MSARRCLPVLCGLLLAGCRQDMHDTPRYEALEKSDFFGDSRSARPLLEGTVARGQLKDDEELHTGRSGRDFVTVFPVAVDEGFIRRGQQRYAIYCAPCHGLLGRGDGMVVRRGYKRPPSFHDERVRAQPAGYFFDVITKGFGTMPDYAAQIPAADRWAIVAYLRALQLSQHATLDDVPAADRAGLGDDASGSAPEGGTLWRPDAPNPLQAPVSGPDVGPERHPAPATAPEKHHE